MTTDTSLLILGRQPALGLAELESLYGAGQVQLAGQEAALVALDPKELDFSRLGGSIKLTRVLQTLDTTKWLEIQKNLGSLLPKLAGGMPEGKLTLGLSAYGLTVTTQKLLAVGLTLKKQLRAGSRPVRLVPNQALALNSAQVLHNKLTGGNGLEIIFVRSGNKTIIAQTLAEQDIESYTLRDRGRPKRDARVGMLPPKLAQIIVNLAGKHLPKGAPVDMNHPYNQERHIARLLDPFCGTGVVLQEAMLLGYDVYGTDIEARMIDYSRTNLDWLRTQFSVAKRSDLATGDATTYQWQQPIDLVACETYLGQPFSSLPSPEKLEQVRGTCNLILEKFLANIRPQITPDTRLCLAIPAWQIAPGKFHHLPLIDRLADLGYNRVRFEHVRDDQLLYYREDQIVARELLVLTRK